MIVLDYQTNTYQIRNSSAQTFTAPYKCFCFFSDIRFDDSGGITVKHIDLDPIQGSQTQVSIVYANNGTPDESLQSVGCVVLNSGERLRFDAVDDADITLHYMRLPEENP